jgi:hypothetical protein
MNFLKTKLFKKSEGKTKESRFLEKTGKKFFQGFFGMKGKEGSPAVASLWRGRSVNWEVIGYQSSVIKNPTNSPLRKGRDQLIEPFREQNSPSNSSPFREGGLRGFFRVGKELFQSSNYSKLFQIKSKFKNLKSEKETSEPVWSLGDGKSTVNGQQGSHQSTVISQQKNHPSSPLQKEGDQLIRVFRKSNFPSNSSPFREGGPRGFFQIAGYRLLMTGRKLFRLFFNTKLRTTLSLVLMVALFTTLFFLQNKSQDSNNQIIVSSINSQEQFQIKKTKDSLALTSENSSITLNQIETEKKDFEIYSHPPKASNLKTQVVYFDDSDLNYQQAEITLKKEKQF